MTAVILFFRVRNKLYHLIKSPTLQTKMIVLIIILLVIVLVLLGTLVNSLLSQILEDQIGKRALHVAETIALMPVIIQAFDIPQPHEVIQPIAEEIRLKTGAEFIVVGNKESIRYSHPLPDRLGKQMVGGDNDLALLEGKSYTSTSIGSLGPSLRGKAPILNEQGEIIGIVSVGFLLEDINEIVDANEYKVIIFILLVLLIGTLGAVFISKSFKKAIFGLEPHQIGRLFKERGAILESIHEGILAINHRGQITMINKTAYDILELDPEHSVVNEHILNILPHSQMLDVLGSGKSQFDQEFIIGTNDVIVNRIPIIINQEVSGVVTSFRKKTDIDQLTKELSQVQRYTDILRSQTHEYSNKLYTISGLIQLGSYQEAIELINKETTGYQEIIQTLIHVVAEPLIAAILLGKYNRAHELKINFTIDPESSMKDLPKNFNQEKLVSILGNIIENAFDSIIESGGGHKQVHIFMTDIGDDLIFEVEDSGKGISDEIVAHIFTKGFSTKQGEKRGYGLYLVHQAVQYLGGYTSVSQSELGGAAFTIVIPKKKGGRE